ncbi:T9SS type B sorting domain-containing protein [Salmonirosea aquatica]|uniref:T9SS type B sorting domain-containing protein n=1 Tax=Salmonirosea aquatica TaxID=2654236 RepID=A0A7C9BA53_9BACT|nr:T9SS type B sorting domain-containing protein [Cytophagaceae bacterium SJW1-29]
MKSRVSVYSLVGWVLFLCLWDRDAQGQCPASLPGLSAYETGEATLTLSGCLPLSVEIHSDLPDVTHIRTLFDYRGGPIAPQSLTPDSVHVYPKPGTYTIVQYAEKDSRQWVTCRTVEVMDTLAPEVRAIPCANGGVQLVFDARQPTDYPTYQVDWGDTEIKGYPGYGKKINYTYAAPQTYTIRVRGVHTPGQCRGAVTRITFVSPKTLNPPAITEARMLDPTKLELKVENSLPTDLILLKGNTQGAFEKTGIILGEKQEKVRTDLERPDKICFQLQPADSCLAPLRSRPVCAADFEASGKPDANTLSWKIPDQPPGSTASIQKDGVPWKDISALGSEASLVDREFVCGNAVCYQLITKHDGFTFYSLKECLTVPLDQCVARPPFYMPDAFSPNGDGINDVFLVQGVVSSDFELSVFNAWGTVVFSTKDPGSAWDGTYLEQKAPGGSYAYAVRFRDVSGRYLTKRGVLLLIR